MNGRNRMIVVTIAVAIGAAACSPAAMKARQDAYEQEKRDASAARLACYPGGRDAVYGTVYAFITQKYHWRPTIADEAGGILETDWQNTVDEPQYTMTDALLSGSSDERNRVSVRVLGGSGDCQRVDLHIASQLRDRGKQTWSDFPEDKWLEDHLYAELGKRLAPQASASR